MSISTYERTRRPVPTTPLPPVAGRALGPAAGDARPDDRRHRPPADRAGARRGVLVRLGDHGVPGAGHRPAAGVRPALRPLRPPADAAGGNEPVRARLRPVLGSPVHGAG